MKRRFAIGAPIVYTKEKLSQSPGQRARNIVPATCGETYSYEVDKYWRVIDILPNGMLQAVTRSGKIHSLQMDDPHLRKARWWERLFLGHRFPNLSGSALPSNQKASA